METSPEGPTYRRNEEIPRLERAYIDMRLLGIAATDVLIHPFAYAAGTEQANAARLRDKVNHFLENRDIKPISSSP